jgi:hypothetical protein
MKPKQPEELSEKTQRRILEGIRRLAGSTREDGAGGRHRAAVLRQSRLDGLSLPWATPPPELLRLANHFNVQVERSSVVDSVVILPASSLERCGAQASATTVVFDLARGPDRTVLLEWVPARSPVRGGGFQIRSRVKPLPQQHGWKAKLLGVLAAVRLLGGTS